MKQKLTKGDIVVFKAEDDWLSKAIAWFTQSDVSHAAMAYSEDSIVELGASGIGIHNVEVSRGDGIYIMRLASEPDPAPLIASADAYLNAKVRYDFPALFILAGLIIYRRIVPTKDVLHVSSQILTASAFMLDEIIQHVILHHTDQAMVCSELVYQIFYDCGGEYRIQIVDGCIWNNATSDNTVRLYDLLPKGEAESSSFTDKISTDRKDSAAAFLTPEETQTLAQELYTALCQSEIQSHKDYNMLNSTSYPKLSHTLSIADKFLSKLQYLLELIKCDLPMEAMFITPGDLVYHAANLKKQGTLDLKRI